MRQFRSLLINNAQLRIPGLEVLTIAAHGHMPELASVSLHRHPWSQAILYLSGGGRQTFSNHRARVEAGTLVMVPPAVSHSFERRGRRAPLCLLIDFRFRGARKRHATVSSLSRSELSQIRQNLVQLVRLHKGAHEGPRCESAVLILQTLMLMLRSAGWLERAPALTAHPQDRAIIGLLGKLQPSAPLTEAVSQSGYQRDHLNRLVKRHTGLTLGQHRAQRRLALARKLLSEGMQVGNVAAAVGLPDQSYFARWFRRQTGVSPSAAHRRLAADTTG
ncbi:MAG: helix-turn-helix domain-containing protein [Verrucomicrobia bacterium]|nr:helix-turn-helix domain-containing protein [Verrucomicrobiota bacterium]